MNFNRSSTVGGASVAESGYSIEGVYSLQCGASISAVRQSTALEEQNWPAIVRAPPWLMKRKRA